MLIRLIFIVALLSGSSTLAESALKLQWSSVGQPCDGQCSITLFGGIYVNDTMTSIFLEDYKLPWQWSYADDYIAGVAVSRKLLSIYDVFQIEPEVGIAKRFGEQSETEIWIAAYLRYTGFPWNDRLFTTVAISTGLSYASGISEKEKARGSAAGSSRLLHYLSPEITFAFPDSPNTSLVFRYHHRSSAYGTFGDTNGGENYATVGLRFKF